MAVTFSCFKHKRTFFKHFASTDSAHGLGKMNFKYIIPISLNKEAKTDDIQSFNGPQSPIYLNNIVPDVFEITVILSSYEIPIVFNGIEF